MLDPENKEEMATLAEVLANTRQAAYINGRLSRIDLRAALQKIVNATSLKQAQEIAAEACYQDDVRAQIDALADVER